MVMVINANIELVGMYNDSLCFQVGKSKEDQKEASTMTILFMCTQFHRILLFVQCWNFANISRVTQKLSMGNAIVNGANKYE
jgi:hypothetical protein